MYALRMLKKGPKKRKIKSIRTTTQSSVLFGQNYPVSFSPFSAWHRVKDTSFQAQTKAGKLMNFQERWLIQTVGAGEFAGEAPGEPTEPNLRLEMLGSAVTLNSFAFLCRQRSGAFLFMVSLVTFSWIRKSYSAKSLHRIQWIKA